MCFSAFHTVTMGGAVTMVTAAVTPSKTGQSNAVTFTLPNKVAADTGGRGNGGGAPVSLNGYGDHTFTGVVADKYLKEFGGSSGMLKDPAWVQDKSKAEIVAKGVLAWAIANGADTFCHWFQPLASNGLRPGQSGQVQNKMIKFIDGEPKWSFDADDLLQGETDGSSFNNGGLRVTCTAGAYLKIDPMSPIFLRGDAIYIPAVLVSFKGDSLDEKTPLHRATDAMSREAKRLFSHLNYPIDGLVCNIGLEQEFFLIPRSAFHERPDLQLVGRTLLGRMPARGQELCDHYMAALSGSQPALACMKEVQEQCLALGIPLKTRHREVAPNQYEMAPYFGTACTQIDQNLVVMQILEETAAKYGLACLLQEKPFAGINGSGKHNNWSLSTTCGTQLMHPVQLNEKSKNPLCFPAVMAAVVAGVCKHGDMMRMSISAPGNDFRLGAMEAPPAVMSTFLGPSMTEYLEKYMEIGEKAGAYIPTKSTVDTGVAAIGKLTIPSEDRNRTSPFPYGGYRFEFRAAGSSQNTSMVNTVLCTMMADGFKCLSEAIEGGATPVAAIQKLLKDNFQAVFNGNGYDPAWPDQARDEKKIWRIDSGVDAIQKLGDEKNLAMFESLGVCSRAETEARRVILLEQYLGTVEMEVHCLINMLKLNVIPSCKKAGVDFATASDGIASLEAAWHQIEGKSDLYEKARDARTLRLETMGAVRRDVDALEGEVPEADWSVASYRQLLFLDSHPL